MFHTGQALPASAALLSVAGFRQRHAVGLPDRTATLLAEALIGLIGVEARVAAGQAEEVSLQAETLTDNADVELWKYHLEVTIESDVAVPETDREALIIIARRGQGLFKQRVMHVEHVMSADGCHRPRSFTSQPL